MKKLTENKISINKDKYSLSEYFSHCKLKTRFLKKNLEKKFSIKIHKYFNFIKKFSFSLNKKSCNSQNLRLHKRMKDT